MIDKTGKQIVFKTFVSEKKNRCWNYTTSNCDEYRKEIFNRFVDGIEATFKISISKIFKRKSIPENLSGITRIIRGKTIQLSKRNAFI